MALREAPVKFQFIPGPITARAIAPGWKRGSDVEETEILWLWEHMIPLGALTLIEGLPGCGKSTIARDLAARVTQGQSMPGGKPGCTGGVLWCSSEEDTSAVLVPGLRRAGADKARVYVLDEEDEGGWESARQYCLRMIEENDIRLVVFDNVVVFLGNEGKETYASVQKALRPWVRLFQQCGVACIGIRHTRKDGSTDAVSAGIGSTAWASVARATLTVGQLDTGVSVCAVAKANLGPKPDPYEFTIRNDGTLCWLGQVAGAEAADLTDHERRGKRDKKPSAKERLRAILEAGPCPRVDVFEAMKDVAEQTVRNAAVSLGVKGDGLVWELPSGKTPDPADDQS